jgi:hypothetical protein
MLLASLLLAELLLLPLAELLLLPLAELLLLFLARLLLMRTGLLSLLLEWACLANALAAAVSAAGRAAVTAAGQDAANSVRAPTAASLDAGAAGTATAGFAFVFATQASILCFCRSCLHALVLVHAQRIGAGEVNVFVVSSVSKTNLVQVHVVTHSWYCARKRVAARPGRETVRWYLHPCCVPFDFSRNTKIFSDSLNLKSFFAIFPQKTRSYMLFKGLLLS